MLALLLASCQQPTQSSPPQSPAAAASVVTPQAAEPSASPTGAALLVLHADGIGDVWLGTPQAEARSALIERLGEPDDEEVEWCELYGTEEESRDRRLTWGDLQVSLREGSYGDVRLEAWSVEGPQTPQGVVTPFNVVPGVDGKATLVRAVPGVSEDEDTNDQLGPGHYVRGQLQWIVNDFGQVTHAYVNPAICD